MAITQLAQGQTTLVTGSSVVPPVPSTATQSAVAGANRLLLVAVGTNTLASLVPLPGQAVAPAIVNPAVTWGNVPLSLLRRDGGDEAIFSLSNVGIVSIFSVAQRSSLHLFAFREAEIAARSSDQIAVSLSLPAGVSAISFRAGYWLLDDCDQSLIVRDFRGFSTSDAVTTIGGSTNPGGTSDAVIVAGLKSELTGSVQITIDGVGITEDFDGSFVTGLGSRFAGGKDLTAGAIAGIPFSMAYTLQTTAPIAIVAAARLAEFFPPNGSVSLTHFPASTVTLEAQ